ncbi:IMP dehydrogenase/GMP reductase [Elusimicrobium minutum Pei191]|uniref:GMP reductase n=1 Tax=Elusimicrobium minutum (strain Pei191) TaxID=445932 RepID=B2KDI6_ELUMP|nr:GMP reductase [Elusimicrobium minutum]ACC98582.1 IMP dehydrogenase/GMP reductase [Elusimicrobium minutum Pei191]
MRIYDDIQLDYCDVLLRPKRSRLSSRSEVDIEREYDFKWCPLKIKGTGVMAANMSTTGTFEIAKIMQKYKLFTALHKHYTAEELIKFLKDNKKNFKTNGYIFISSGVSEEDYKKIQKVMKTKLINNICIDVANGYSPYLINYVKKVRAAYPKCLIMAGNVVTGDMTEDLLLNGADIVKVGIGPGSVCTTRKLTGVGRPQFSTVIECSDAAHGVGGMICADGGCTVAGDVCKSFCAGADFIMLGGMLAGHEESAGDVIKRVYITTEVEDTGDEQLKYVLKEKYFKKFYGMSSEYAQDLFYGGLKKYRASEGKLVEIPYRGEIEKTILAILGGVRSAMTYVGAKRIKDMPKCATFYRVNRQLNTVFGNE